MRKIKTLLAVIAVGIGMLVAANPAAASIDHPTDTYHYCWALASDTDVPSYYPTGHCYADYDTFHSAWIAWGTGLSIDYQDVNYGGWQLTWVAPNAAAGCRDTDWYTDHMPDGWNDVVSSSKPISSYCQYQTYSQDSNQNGPAKVFATECGDTWAKDFTSVGFNDQTSSEFWRDGATFDCAIIKG